MATSPDRSRPAAIAARSSAAARVTSALGGRSPWLGASMAAAANPPSAANRTARAVMPGARLCCPPPWPSRISGRGPATWSGVHSTPGISSTVNDCSVTPSADDSEVKRIRAQPFRMPSGLPPSGEPREEAPIGHNVDRTHLLHERGRCPYHRLAATSQRFSGHPPGFLLLSRNDRNGVEQKLEGLVVRVPRSPRYGNQASRVRHR